MFRFLLGVLLPSAQAASLINLPTGAISTNPSDAVPDLALRVLDILTFIAYPLAFLSIAVTAYILISSAGKPEALQTAKKNILNLTIGIFLITFAIVLLRFVLQILIP